MRKWLLIGLMLTLVVQVGGGVHAQAGANTPVAPIGTLEAGDFRALAVTNDGNRLLVGDAENNQVRVYNFSDPTQPNLLTSLDVNGTPVLLAGGDNFGVVATQTDGRTDSVELIAPAYPSPRAQYRAGWSIFDIPKNPHALALSPDAHWGLVASEASYALLEINDPGNVDWISVDEVVVDAALTNTVAYLLRADSIVAAPLQSGEALRGEQVLTLDGTPSHLAVDARATLGVVVLDNTRLEFFDPAALKTTGELRLDGGAVTNVSFLAHDGGELVLVTQDGQPSIRMFDARDPQNVVDLGNTGAMRSPIHALVTHDQLMVVTDGTTISIFSS